jgi:hypothetical protein
VLALLRPGLVGADRGPTDTIAARQPIKGRREGFRKQEMRLRLGFGERPPPDDRRIWLSATEK